MSELKSEGVFASPSCSSLPSQLDCEPAAGMTVLEYLKNNLGGCHLLGDK